MIYYNDSLVDLNNPKNDAEKEIADQVKTVKAKYFGERSKGYALLLYPDGRRVKNESGWLELARPFPIFTISADGLYRMSYIKQSKGADGIFKYDDGYELVYDGTRLYIDKLELIWFLTYHSEDLKKNRLAFEDTAAIAKEKVKQFSFDTELNFYLFGSSSPVTTNNKLLAEIAMAFGVRDINTMNEDEVKLALRDAIIEGEKSKDRSCNFALFLEMTKSVEKLNVLTLVRRLMASKELYFDSEEYAWFLQGSDIPFFKVKGQDLAIKEQLVLDACMNSTVQQQMLGRFSGKDTELTADTILSMKRTELQTTCKLQGIVAKPNDSNEVLQDKLLNHFGLER